MTSTQKTATIVKVVALDLLVAMLLAALVSTAPAGAAVTSGKAFAWGYNEFGQLGNDTSDLGTEKNIPGVVSNLSSVKSVKAGGDHSLALKTDGTVRAWGYNDYGQLGNGTSGPGTDRDLPVKVQIENVKAISAGYNHNLALKENGSVWAWGQNNFGQLGNDTSGPGTDKNIPIKVASLGTGVKGIAAGHNFSLALMQDGTVRSWGYNSDGQLGDGTNDPRDTPGLVSNLSGVKAIATDGAAYHSLALLNDGTVRAWGYNNHGQLGNGASLPGTEEATPVRVKNLANVEAMATGGYHSLAVLESGKVRAWGYNYSGQLGNDTHGDGTDRSTPGSVIGLENVRSISGGAYQSFAVLESGRARAWGYNEYGQLGNGASGTAADTDVPVAVKNLTNVRNMDGGYVHTLASTQ